MPSISFFGAAGTVTGAKYLLNTGHDQVLVDCGLFQGMKEWRLRNWDPLPFPPPSIDAVVITHAHIDHSGYFPKLVRDGYRGPVFATGATVDLCQILLADSGELQEEQAAHANRHGWSKHSPALPLYTGSDAHYCMRFFSRYPFDTQRRLLRDVSLRLRYAGHILGAAIAEIWLADRDKQVKVVFSGDLGRYGDPLFDDPVQVADADYVVVESTYGDRLHSQRPAPEELAEVINEAAGRGGILLIPAFSVGRTQRLLYEIKKLEETRAIPVLPVYVDSPMAIDATEIFLDYPKLHRVGLENTKGGGKGSPLACRKLRLVRSQRESIELDDLQEAAILISASGMATGGRVLHHLTSYLPDPRATVLFAGFQAAGTRGRQLVDGAKEVKMLGRMIPVNAQVRTIEAFSAHADGDELMRWLRGFERAPRSVFVVHGEPSASAHLAQRIEDELGFPTHVPSYAEVVQLGGESHGTGGP